jgi:electron transport complex protein RnfC
MGLEPYLIATFSSLQRFDELEKECITNCISCGSCQYTCPAHRPLLDNIVQGKAVVMEMIKSRNKK